MKAQQDLEKIEYSKRTWNSKFMREMEIWKAIAERINDTKGKEQKHWIEVMKLYKDKYKNESNPQG